MVFEEGGWRVMENGLLASYAGGQVKARSKIGAIMFILPARAKKDILLGSPHHLFLVVNRRSCAL
jgi:hypothetical protein